MSTWCFARWQEWVKRGVGACVVAGSLLAPASAQTFVNLDFEQARVPPAGEPNQTSFLPWSEAAPGWGHSDGDSTEGVYYLNGHLGFSQVYILEGAPGSFAMGLRNGTFHEQEPRGEFVQAFLSQHGTIPVGTRELVLFSSDWNFRVEINGEPISMRPARAGVPSVDYSLLDYIGNWTGDVSSFDGQAVDLKIINAYPASDYLSHLLIVDDIRLLPIPEPPVHVLMAVGVAALLLSRWRVKRISRRNRSIAALATADTPAPASIRGPRAPGPGGLLHVSYLWASAFRCRIRRVDRPGWVGSVNTRSSDAVVPPGSSSRLCWRRANDRFAVADFLDGVSERQVPK